MRGAVTPNSPSTVGQLHPTAEQALAYDLRPAATLVPEQPDEIVLRHVQRFIRQQRGPREGAVGHATFGVMSCLLRRQSADTGDGRRDNPGRPFGLKARALNGYFPGPLSASVSPTAGVPRTLECVHAGERADVCGRRWPVRGHQRGRPRRAGRSQIGERDRGSSQAQEDNGETSRRQGQMIGSG